jgi:hypothetical protein
VLAGGGGASAEIMLTNGVATINNTLVGATSDGVVPSCGQAANDVWYRFTPPATATYIIKTCGSSLTWDSLVSVWSNCTTQVPGACGDAGCSSSNHASLTFPLTAGTPYLVRVSAFSLATPNIDTFRLVVAGQGACCTGNSACPNTGVCYITDPVSCTSALGTFQGFAAPCTPTTCPNVFGQCCMPDLTCTRTCAEACHAGGGTFGQIGSNCKVDTTCPVGVCCRGSTCVVTTNNQCPNGVNQQFKSIGDQCNQGNNRQTPCCKADYNQDGQKDVNDIFAYLGGWFSSNPIADIGGLGNGQVNNIFIYLAAWFAGCP